MMVDIRSQTREDLQNQFILWDQPVYRVAQLLQWLYARRVESWEAMSNLPKALRLLLQQTYAIRSPSWRANKVRAIRRKNFCGVWPMAL